MDRNIRLRIERVKQIDRPDGWGGGNADYYVKVRIDGIWLKSTHRENVTDWRPNWTFTRLSAGNSSIPIRIELWDHDHASGDDHCDINPSSSKKRLDLNYNVRTGRVTGDMTAARGARMHARGSGNSDRAEIWFRITTITPRMPRRLPEVWASDLRIKALWNATATGRNLTVLETRLRGFNDRLYSCTDGQWRVGRFLIHDNRSELSKTDRGVGHVHKTTATYRDHGHADGRPNNPKHWEVKETSGAGVYLMEFLHSWTGLKDEYEVSEGGASTNCPATRALRTATEACVMDMTSGTRKLCRPETHNPNTEQGNVRKMDCYSWLRKVMRAAGHTRFRVPGGHVPGPASAPALKFIYLTIQRVEQIDRPDGFAGGQADYYAKVRMDGLWFAKSKHQSNRRTINPSWIFGFAYSNSRHLSIRIRIELWDHDSTSSDELCDINSRRRKKFLDITYNTGTGRIAGDLTGNRNTTLVSAGSGDSNRARIRFRITSR